MPGTTICPDTTYTDTPRSKFCTTKDDTGVYWLDFLINLVFTAFLIRLRYLSRKAAVEEDHANWTTADYAVLISGLDDRSVSYADDYEAEKGEVVPGLETRLRADLEALGFSADDIAQIELGRFCEDEIDLLTKLKTTRRKEDELQVGGDPTRSHPRRQADEL